MSDEYDPFADFSPENDEEFVADLDTLKAKAVEARDLMLIKEDLEEQVSQLNARLRHLTEREIPYIMAEMGMKKFELADGSKIGVKEIISGSLQKAPDFEFAKQYVIDHDGEDLIKTEVTTVFGKGEHNSALDLAQTLREDGHDVKCQEGIHASTYAAWGRERHADYLEGLSKGLPVVEIPFEALGLYHGKKAEIKIPKGKK